jgi:hypothetical protein
MCSSAGPGRSQQLEIPPSLNSKRAACFSSSASISMDAGMYFTRPKDFTIRLIFTRRKDFTIRLIFTRRKDFTIRLIFTRRKNFSIRLIFTGRKHFVDIFSAYIFDSAFLLSIADILIGAIISGL